ncbi:hypothetical protein M1D80_11820 [Phyllobacteriaceae bacterium JZ32]
MAFKIRSLIRMTTVPIEPGRRVNFYRYASNDAAATVIAAGYFNEARAELTKGDIIEAVVAHSTTPDHLLLQVADSPGSGDVTVTDLGAAAP